MGVQIYVSLVTNWLKRGGSAIAGLDPENLDRELLMQLLVEADPTLAALFGRAVDRFPGAHDPRPRRLRRRRDHLGGGHPGPVLHALRLGVRG